MSGDNEQHPSDYSTTNDDYHFPWSLVHCEKYYDLISYVYQLIEVEWRIYALVN